MFERFDEDARRALFFARLEAHERGGASIELEHILLGILRAAPDAVLRFTNAHTTAASMVAACAEQLSGGPRLPATHELPFAPAVRKLLSQAHSQSEALGQRFVRPEHYVLTLLDEEPAPVYHLLRDSGIERAKILEFLRSDAKD
jgi:ATP-dependent Clp protease ATP-binding subunit ClpA